MIFIFWIGTLFILIVPVYIGIVYHDYKTGLIALVGGAFLIFISRLDVIAELSLGPVKAKMKKKIDEATATIQQLQEIATMTSEATLTDLMAGSFMGSMSLAKRLEVHDKVISSLKKIGASPEQIASAEKDWRKGISVIYLRAIKYVLEQRTEKNRINTKLGEERKQASQEIEKLNDFTIWKSAMPEQIRDILKRRSIDDPAVNDWVDDYECFLEKNEIRRQEQFGEM